MCSQCSINMYRQRELTRVSVRSVVPSMMKMGFKMLGSNVTTMTVEGGSITGAPVSAGCQALEKVHVPLLLLL